MDIDYLIDAFDNDAGHKEEIALIIYFLENNEDDGGVTQAEVKEVIRNSRSAVSTNSVSTYFNRLSNAGWISEANGENYILTHDGEDGVEELIDDGALDNSRDEEDEFLNIDNFDDSDNRYERLVEDINETYQYRLYDATMILTRKFFEDIVFQILKIHYAGEDNQMFYDQKNNRHYSFNDLLNNLRDSVPTLRQYARELDQVLVDDLRDLKDEGNSGAHAIRVNFTDKEIERWASDATRIAEVLYEVLRGARIADKHNE